MSKDWPEIKKIKRYEIIRPIGEGGRGRVYLANDKIIRRPVAIKIFSLEALTSETRPREKVLRDFFLETQTAGALLHPNIVVVYDLGKKDDALYIVMEFVFGKTLLQHMQTSGFSVKKTVEIVYELALALDFAHSKGVIHRDIKPENIIVSVQGVPKITDFGIARFRRHLLKSKQKLVGSARFMAPEQVLRRPQDHRVDIYQLGVVLFELLTRQLVFRGSNAQDILNKICVVSPPPPGRLNPNIPPEVDRIVERCLEKSPQKRFETARDLADALAVCLRSGGHAELPRDHDLTSRLKKFEMFSLFTDKELEAFVSSGDFITCKEGETIIRENESDSNFFVLLEGNVKVTKGERVLSNFLPGACFGEIGAFARQTRYAAVEAETDCKLLQINALIFKELDPSIQLKVLNIVVRNLARLVISLDGELSRMTGRPEPEERTATICPLCGLDNGRPIEVCPRCGVIASTYGALRRNLDRYAVPTTTTATTEESTVKLPTSELPAT